MTWVQTFNDDTPAVFGRTREEVEQAAQALGDAAWGARRATRPVADAEIDPDFAAELAAEAERARIAMLAETKPDGTVAKLIARLPDLTIEQLQHLLLAEAKGAARKSARDVIWAELVKRNV